MTGIVITTARWSSLTTMTLSSIALRARVIRRIEV